MFGIKFPALTPTNIAIAVAIAVLAIKFRVQILKGFAGIPLVGPAVQKFANS